MARILNGWGGAARSIHAISGKPRIWSVLARSAMEREGRKQFSILWQILAGMTSGSYHDFNILVRLRLDRYSFGFRDRTMIYEFRAGIV